jgi:hypothetical protein
MKTGWDGKWVWRVKKITCIMKPPHCLTWKCQKLNQFSNSLKLSYIHYPWGIPPTMDSCIMNACLFQWGGILIFIPQGPVLFSHFWFDLLVCVFVHSLSLVKVTHLLPIYHWFIWIPTTIHNLNNVPIGLSVVSHETIEVWIRNTFHQHHLIQFSP